MSPLSSSATPASEKQNGKPGKPGETNGHVAQNGDAVQAEASEAAEANGSSKKRKADEDDIQEPATTKATKQESREEDAPSTAKHSAQLKTINYLLSTKALDQCRPKDEKADLDKDAEDEKHVRTYSDSDFTPFEELLSALILSRPIGHMLGVRSIRTLFNAPLNLNTPQAIIKAGNDGCREALDEAHTQHRQKTAEEMVLLAQAVESTFGDDDDDSTLERVRKECDHKVEAERSLLTKNIKGMGPTGMDIFARRIQGQWAEWYPFADQRTLGALSQLGLGDKIEDVVQAIESNWPEIDAKETQNVKDEATKKRKVLVTILDRAIGADLEGKIDEVKAAA